MDLWWDVFIHNAVHFMVGELNFPLTSQQSALLIFFLLRIDLSMIWNYMIPAFLPSKLSLNETASHTLWLGLSRNINLASLVLPLYIELHLYFQKLILIFIKIIKYYHKTMKTEVFFSTSWCYPGLLPDISTFIFEFFLLVNHPFLKIIIFM